jgi:hypothetical protein
MDTATYRYKVHSILALLPRHSTLYLQISKRNLYEPTRSSSSDESGYGCVSVSVGLTNCLDAYSFRVGRMERHNPAIEMATEAKRETDENRMHHKITIVRTPCVAAFPSYSAVARVVLRSPFGALPQRAPVSPDIWTHIDQHRSSRPVINPFLGVWH